ncbi:MAG: hypothetical protein ABIJ56_02560 [Pseudomonadota bacterium]
MKRTLLFLLLLPLPAAVTGCEGMFGDSGAGAGRAGTTVFAEEDC